MPRSCHKKELFEGAKIFLSDFYGDTSTVVLNGSCPAKEAPIKVNPCEFEKTVEHFREIIEECCKKNNVVHCEFCNKLKQNQN